MPDMTKSGFQTTRWSLVQAAASDPTGVSRQALSTICLAYWHPVYAFIRRNGYDPDQSQDLTQGFFARLLEKNDVSKADQARGKFRSFLLTSVKHFLANEWDRSCALKRGGGKVTLSIDFVKAERWYTPSVVDTETPEVVFERRWALSVLERVMTRLRKEFATDGQSDLFQILAIFLSQDSSEVDYEELAEELDIPPGTLRTKVYRMRQKYRRLLREEIAETVSTVDEINEEIRFLASRLSD
jgi:RNA polymerase sigma-70 factor (ECF subfamily)